MKVIPTVIRDKLALWLIRAARKVTTFGFVDDYLEKAEEQQLAWTNYYRRTR